MYGSSNHRKRNILVCLREVYGVCQTDRKFVQHSYPESRKLAGLAFTHLFIMVPYTIWMSRGFIKTIPFTVEEAALIDGCNKIQAIVKVVLPMISSGLFAVGLYAFMLSWEEFLFAYTFTGSEASKTITVGLSTLIGEDTSDWGGIMAASIMMGLPVLIFFFSVQDTFIKGIVGGAVKG